MGVFTNRVVDPYAEETEAAALVTRARKSLTGACRALGARVKRVTVTDLKGLGAPFFARLVRRQADGGPLRYRGCDGGTVADVMPLLRLPTHILYFSRAPQSLRSILVDYSDGYPSGPALVAFCSRATGRRARPG